ncbi:ribonuclease H-like domain-containing protein [Tricharina praecox]|uniref:ribonuclease H-like domain-containing protein n=1 Tax=Tricharina praecox TaxID=43433 RepID=UPI00221F0370|nr:ribonuclease H-like domain-containing protein [Tricharina praecox]KAI5854690.1 ribonuclease H-like domain-containing protein [Tricharina praecox]
MGVLRDLVEQYPYVAMDTEFPGIVARPIGKFPSKADYHYQTLRCNVDMLKIIQLGITLADENGDLAKVDGSVSTWQFNFRFNLDEDMYAQDSIDLLTKSGIDFGKHTSHGIDVFKFGELLITSGLVMLDEVKWISFHSGYDFGYLVKIMSCTPLPKEEADFRIKLKTFFPSLYDIKYLMKSCRNLKGGLQDIAEEMGIPRIGPQHQAGSDSLLTGMIFFAMRQRYFEGKIDDALYLGQVWGLNGNSPMPLANGTAGSNGASSNAGSAPNPPKTPTMNGSQQGTQGTPDNNSTPGRNGTPGTPGYTPGFGKGM